MEAFVLGTPSRGAILGHPTAFDDAWGGPFPDGGPGPDFLSLPGGQEGHLPGCLASPTEAGRGGGRPLLHEALLLGSRSALRTTETRRNPENRDLEASSWGPPHDEPFRATRQRSTTRGEAPFQRGATRRFSAPATRAGRPFTRLSGLSHRGRESRRKAAFLHETLLLGSGSALWTTEHAETQDFGGLVLDTPSR